MSPLISELLIQQRRYQEAEAALRQYLAQQPEDGTAHSLLAVALAFQERYDDALFEGRQGIQYTPNSGYSYQAQAMAYRGLKKYDEAAQAIQQAIQLEPETAEYYTQLAQIRLDEEMWDEAIRVTDTALRLDPHNVSATTIRAHALQQMGQTREASVLRGGLLERDPNKGGARAVQGWAMLHQGQVNEALERFREALRLNPDDTHAQVGIIEALKARNPIYRVMQTYFLWMARLSKRSKVMFIVGFVISLQFILRIGNRNPSVKPIADVVLFAGVAFAYLTWTSPLLSDLALRVHRVGRFALPPARKQASNVIGVLVLLALGLLVGGLVMGGDTQDPLLGGAIKSAVLIVPVAGMFTAANPTGKSCLFFWTMGLVTLALSGLKAALDGEPPLNDSDKLFMLGMVGYIWVAAAIITGQRTPFKPQ